MNPRVSEIIDLLGLEPHVGGGYIRNVFRSENRVHLPGSLAARRAMTAAYYLLAAGEYDCWHRLVGDEVWHYIEGAPLELIWIEPGEERCTRALVGEVGSGSRPVAVVPGGCWQMARTTGAYSLVGCTMGPGFEVEDYQQLKDDPEAAREIAAGFPEFAPFI